MIGDERLPLLSNEKNEDEEYATDLIIRLCTLGLPLSFSIVLQYLTPMITLLFAATYRDIDIYTGVGLAMTVINISCAFLIGITFTTTVKTGELFGRNDFSGVAYMFQRSLLILIVFSIPTILLFLFPEPILVIIIGQNASTRAVIQVTGTFLSIRAVGIPANVLYWAIDGYLCAIEVTETAAIAQLVSIVLVLILNYLFVFVFNFDYSLLAWTLVIHSYIVVIIFIVLSLMRQAVLKTLFWWSWTEALDKWHEFLCLGLVMAISYCAEWWAYEIITVLSIKISVEAGAAFLTIYQLISFQTCLGIGLCTALQVIFLNNVGKGNHTQTLNSVKIIGVVLACFFGFLALLVFLFGQFFIEIFTLTHPGIINY
jgi:MATE family multidrug resistance protein